MNMDFSIVYSICLSTAVGVLGLVKFVTSRKDRSKAIEEARTNERIKNSEENCMKAVAANKQLGSTLEEGLSELDRRIQVVERRAIDRETLKEYVETRVGPIESSVAKLSEVVSRGFSEVKQTQINTERDIQKVLEGVSETKGSLRTFLDMQVRHE